MSRSHFRHRSALFSIVATAALLIGVLAATTPAQASPKPAASRGGVEVYVGDLTYDQLKRLNATGLDDHNVVTTRSAQPGRTRVEVILSDVVAGQLAKQGVRLDVKKVDGKDSTARTRAALAGQTVYRPYSGAGNIREELLKVAADNPTIAKAVDIGTSLQGKPITAIRLSKNVGTLRDGQRPAVIYQATQHAREWITPETVRRLLHHYVNGYGSNAELTNIVNTTDLWFVPVVNVDGYDLTFQDGFRLWRKNARDNNGDGQLTGGDGVDLNRNFSYKWGYDNEGSSPQPTSETYRGTAPNSEPETKAQDALYKRLKPKYIINWHSAAQLLLYGVGWQALTPSPDDIIHKALLGDTDNPAVPGYVPQLGAQLYTTNGETDGHAENNYGALAITPEQATCATAAGYDPNDEWEAADCGSGFEFPDDEKLIQFEFTKNLPLALSVAKSAHNPDNPVSPVGRTAADFEVGKFGVSLGSTQEVRANIRRSLANKDLVYRINGGKVKTDGAREWRGGERFGDENDHYYGEFRGKVSGQRPGDRVEVWFEGTKAGKRVASERFTYTVRDRKGADVVIIADEDYTGVNPTYPAGTNAPRYAQEYSNLVKSAKHKPYVWDIDKDGAPNDLGVLSHFKGAIWYLGDNRLTQDAADEPVRSVIGDFPDSQVADRAKDTLLSVRSFLNEGGKLLYTGETVGYNGPLAQSNGGGIYYGLKGHPEQPCFLSTSFRDDCELLSDDFMQYWLGGFDRQLVGAPTGFTGTDRPFGKTNVTLGGTPTNQLNEAGGFQVTSTVLPTSTFPQFRSWKAADFIGAAAPTEPFAGQWYVAGPHADATWRRLTRTIDLTSVTAAQAPTLQAMVSYSTESGFDHVLLEARTAGGDDWTTLPEKNGRSSNQVPVECEAGYFMAMHPFLGRYLTGGNPCRNTGTSGSWNSLTGSSGGWIPVAFDLSAYAGKQVEVSFAYASDPASGGTGLFIDETQVTTSGGQLDAEGFESGLGPWTIAGAPAGSPGNATEFLRTEALVDTVSAVATRDSLVLGFGLEQIPAGPERQAVMRKALDYLLG